MTQQNFFLKILENLIRSNLYVFIFMRFIVNKLFTKFIYDTDFKIIKILNKNNYFKDLKRPILDIGANDGISYKFIKNFLKNNLIYSFEPLKIKFNQLKRLRNKDKNYKILNYGLSNKAALKKIYIPFFKKYALSSFAGLNKRFIVLKLKENIFVRNLLNKIKFKSELIKLQKLDDLHLNPNFIKIDIEGHEYECILGSIKTIKKNKPILLIENNYKNYKKINNNLKKIGYKAYYYDNKNSCIKLYKNKKVLNIIYVHNNHKQIIQNDHYKT